MLMIECCPPFQWRPRYKKFGRFRRFMWGYLAVTKCPYDINDLFECISDAGLELAKRRALGIEPPKGRDPTVGDDVLTYVGTQPVVGKIDEVDDDLVVIGFSHENTRGAYTRPRKDLHYETKKPWLPRDRWLDTDAARNGNGETNG